MESLAAFIAPAGRPSLRDSEPADRPSKSPSNGREKSGDKPFEKEVKNAAKPKDSENKETDPATKKKQKAELQDSFSLLLYDSFQPGSDAVISFQPGSDAVIAAAAQGSAPAVVPTEQAAIAVSAALPQPTSSILDTKEIDSANPSDGAAIEIKPDDEKILLTDSLKKATPVAAPLIGEASQQKVPLDLPVPIQQIVDRPAGVEASANTALKFDSAPQAHSAQNAEIAGQVLAAIKSDRTGNGFEIRLDPPDLGRVRMHFTFDRTDAVTATVSTDRSDTLDIMRRHSADLVKELTRSGFADVQLQFTTGGDRAFQNASPEETSVDTWADDPSANETDVIYVSNRIDNRLDRLV